MATFGLCFSIFVLKQKVPAVGPGLFAYVVSCYDDILVPACTCKVKVITEPVCTCKFHFFDYAVKVQLKFNLSIAYFYFFHYSEFCWDEACNSTPKPNDVWQNQIKLLHSILVGILLGNYHYHIFAPVYFNNQNKPKIALA
jgi:hypothetical protein